MACAAAALRYRGLRGGLETIARYDELERVFGAHWDALCSPFAIRTLLVLRKQLLAHLVETRFLIVAERIVEIRQRRLHGPDCLEHGFKPVADSGETVRRGRRHFSRTRGLDGDRAL